MISNRQKKLAVVFPGMGYHTDKPLLYYMKKLAKQMGYEILELPYSRLLGEDREKAYETAQQYAAEHLADAALKSYGTVLFISKSIGTVVAGALVKKQRLKVRQICLTPVGETLAVLGGNEIVFSGRKDPMVDTGELEQACRKKRLPLHLVDEANHSLETGDAIEDIRILGEIVEHCGRFLSA